MGGAGTREACERSAGAVVTPEWGVYWRGSLMQHSASLDSH